MAANEVSFDTVDRKQDAGQQTHIKISDIQSDANLTPPPSTVSDSQALHVLLDYSIVASDPLYHQ